jgi:cytochrome c-type biogenesis protein CcmH
MSPLWAAATIVTAIVVAGLVWASMRRSAAAAGRLSYDINVYKDQLDEIEQELAQGLITDAEAEAARTEIERRILAAAEAGGDAQPPATAPAGGGRLMVSAVVIVGIPALAFGLYARLGSPQYPNVPYAERQDTTRTAATNEPGKPADDIQTLAARLAQRMEEDPGNLRGWLLLGRTYQTMDRDQDAVTAFRKAAELAPEDMAVAIELAESLVLANERKVVAEARELFKSVLSSDARNPRARYYLALADAQDGNLKAALQGWVDLVAVSHGDAPWLGTVRQSIQNAAKELNIDPMTVEPTLTAKLLGPGKRPESTPAPPPTAAAPPAAAPGPSREDMEAAQQMSAEDRNAMIRSMVERLAERMKDNPNDLAGWQRLARAYRVLGETQKAEEAEARIRALQ